MGSMESLVSGTLNLETTFPVNAFPLACEPIRYRCFAPRSQPSGLGFNVARALTVPGNRVRLMAIAGPDYLGMALRGALPDSGLSDQFVLVGLKEAEVG